MIISDQAVIDGLRDLKAHGIDHRLLFPDLLGAAKLCQYIMRGRYLSRVVDASRLWFVNGARASHLRVFAISASVAARCSTTAGSPSS
jgi:hypothetical protein